MKLIPNIELVNIANDYMAVPVGDTASSFGGVVALSSAAYYLLDAMREPKSVDDLVQLLTSNYEVDEMTARQDVQVFVDKLVSLELIEH